MKSKYTKHLGAEITIVPKKPMAILLPPKQLYALQLSSDVNSNYMDDYEDHLGYLDQLREMLEVEKQRIIEKYSEDVYQQALDLINKAMILRAQQS
jgi:hypothetical protein